MQATDGELVSRRLRVMPVPGWSSVLVYEGCGEGDRETCADPDECYSVIREAYLACSSCGQHERSMKERLGLCVLEGSM